MRTDIIKFLFLMTDKSLTSLGKRVPDLIDYKYSKIISFDSNLNDNLNKLIGLSEQEVIYIKSKIRK